MLVERFVARDVLVLIAVGCAQLLGILDATIVTNAIPLAAEDLGISSNDRQWIVTAYALAFGAMLLIGGRIADYWGRKRTLILGISLFILASTWGGLSSTGIELMLARALQGGSAALMAPAAVSIISVRFPEGRLRAIAFGVLGGISSSGAALGLILGGVLAQFSGWRWCLLVNIPVGVLAIAIAAFALRETRVEGRPRYDFPGAVLVATGVAATVFGLSRMGNPQHVDALPVLCVGVALLAGFVLVERRARSPILPLGIVLNRSRGGALIVQICSGTALASVTLYLTLHLQLVLGLSPLFSGLAMLPLAFGIAIGIRCFAALSRHVGMRGLLILCPVGAGAGVFAMSRLTANGSYWVEVFPGLAVMGFGLGGIFFAAQNVALSGVISSDAGAAGAALQAATQVGGAAGLAILTNVFSSSVGASTAAGDQTAATALVFVVTSAILLAASVTSALLIRRPLRAPSRTVAGR